MVNAGNNNKYNGISPNAPKELLHWKSMIGDWVTREESLKPDGSGWKKSKGAEWKFYWGLNGWAIIDDYISPPLIESVSEPTKRQIGMNIRTFDPVQKKWSMVWITKDGKTINQFSATSNEQQIVMLSKKPNASGKMTRITFFNMNNDHFEWKYEVSKDGKTNWLEVYRIHGTRK